MSLDKLTGNVFKSNKYGNMLVIEYISSEKVKVKFINTGYITYATMGNIKRDSVKDRFFPSVYGVGYVGDSKTKINGETLREYVIWKGFMKRCYDTTTKNIQPTYLNCQSSENFKNFTYFKNWCKEQVGFINLEWDLDKDILGDGSIYHEDVCVFVPREINLIFNSDLSVLKGVTFNKQRDMFAAQICDGGGNRFLGYFENEKDARNNYLREKSKRISFLADKYRGCVDYRVYDKLISLKEEHLKNVVN